MQSANAVSAKSNHIRKPTEYENDFGLILVDTHDVSLRDFARPNAVADDFRDSISDTTAPFGALAPGGIVGGRVEVGGDRDLFAISLVAGQSYVFSLNRGSSGGLSDPILRLLSNTGSQLAINDDFGGSLNSRISVTVNQTGTYYLEAAGYGSRTGTYTLSSTGTSPAPTDDYRDSLSDTSSPLGSFTIGTPRTGRIETSGDKDIFAVSVQAGQTYTFDLTTSASGGLPDPYLRLLNGSGGQLAVNDDFGGSLNARLSYTATSTGTLYLEATSAVAAQTGNYTLTGSASGGGSTGGGFDIVIRYTGDPQYQAAFDAAAARWEEVITGDLPNFTSSRYGTIDDLLIDASAIAIDGPGAVLGRAGPDTFRSGSLLPAHGIMEFDSADLAGLAADGSLVGVILHEMGHVLGIGTLWDSLGLENNFRYTGANALAEYRTLSGNPNATFIPVENDGGAGTAGGHWEEDIFGTELMTGFANGALPMSRMTIASLRDLGYTVNLAEADPYSLPGNLRARMVDDLVVAEPVFGIL